MYALQLHYALRVSTSLVCIQIYSVSEPVMETERENKDDLFLRAVRMNDVAMTEKMLNEGMYSNSIVS